MMTLLQDLRHGARLLVRAPGFAVIAIAALAIGIGANTAIFSVVNTLLLQPLPYHDADRLAIVWEHNIPRDRKNNVVAPANFLHWREMNQGFADLARAQLDVRRDVDWRRRSGRGPDSARDGGGVSDPRCTSRPRTRFHARGDPPQQPRRRHQRSPVETALRGRPRPSCSGRSCRAACRTRSSASCRQVFRFSTGPSMSGCPSGSPRRLGHHVDDRSRSSGG